jgi:molybdopterin synthase sulfur carrier subunit
MQVEFEFYATIRDAVGEAAETRTVESGATVEEALAALVEAHPDVRPLLYDGEGRVRPNINVLVDGTNIRDAEGPETPLSAGTTVGVVPGVAGGRR